MTQFKRKTHRAQEALSALSRRYPSAWKAAEEFRSNRDDLPAWPDWCYLPMAGWHAVVSAATGQRTLTAPNEIADVARLAALGAWRMTQSIYRFDPALYAAVVDTPLEGDLPSSVLYLLPEWCVYIETPELEWAGRPLHGVWTHLEYDVNANRSELRFLVDSELGLYAIVIHLGDWPLDEAIERAVHEAARQATLHQHTRNLAELKRFDAAQALRPLLQPLMSLLLYLCAAGADFTRRGKPGQPENPKPVKTRRRGWQLFPAGGPTEWDVGVRIGAALRAAYQQEQQGAHGAPTGRQVRPHVRRAHWHTILSGPRKREDGSVIPANQRNRELRWMPPIAVNVADLDAMPVVVRPVK